MLPRLDQHPGFHDAPGKIRRLYELINNLATYLGQNAVSIVNYCRRYRSGQPISSSQAESAASRLVNARMNNKWQMRWTPIGADRVLQVRAAVADGRLKQASSTWQPNPQLFPANKSRAHLDAAH
jgi:hypothetical protein